MKPVRLLLPTVALALVSLALPSPPAGAVVLNPLTVVGGNLSINLVPAMTVQLNGAAPAPCPIPAAQRPTMGLNVTAAGGTWTTGIATFTTVAPLSFTYGGSTWFLAFTRSAVGIQAGTIGAPPGYAWNQASQVDAQIYPETAPGSCVANLAAPVCAGPFTITTPAAATFGGRAFGAGIVGETIVAGTAFDLFGPGSIVAPACVAPFAALNGSIAADNPLRVQS